MSSSDRSGMGASLSLNGLLGLLTVVGGMVLVSSRLASPRPVAPPSQPSMAIGSQTLDARLWDDPFRPSGMEAANLKPVLPAELVRQLQSAGRSTNGVRLLPVMVAGGPYGEDKESRIRTRFAVTSALGRRGYAPQDAEHLGEVVFAWPSVSELKQHLDCGGGVPSVPDRPGQSRPWTRKLPVRFEWYRPRDFYPRVAAGSPRPDVLVLWLDDDAFEDQPLVRLAGLLRTLGVTGGGSPPPTVKLMGPRRSATLRAMLPGFQSLAPAVAPRLQAEVTNVLQQVELYSPTVSAMDAVLVKAAGTGPRRAVREELSRSFHSARFFNADDGLLAGEIMAELKRRGVDLADPANHVALITEGDTFYGRTLSLTYAAMLALPPPRPPGMLADYVNGYRNNLKGFPSNLTAVNYVRGLDGQSVGGTGPTPDATPSRRGARIESVNDVFRWTPDANQAEGPAQFDYLSRVGGELQTLDKRLAREGQGRLQAIGIVGSDVYDTLLILQALRPRFPQVLFFTTELDVRYWHPRERAWARNLIIASSYGLSLHPDLQGGVPPFRDSAQTAMFTAVMAALDDPLCPEFAHLESVPPRVFEVGNQMAVDFSTAANTTGNGRPLHPLTRSEAAQLGSTRHWWRQQFALVGAGTTLALVLMGGIIPWLRRWTLDAFTFPSLAFRYGPEDLGDALRIDALLAALARSTKPAAQELSGWFAEAAEAHSRMLVQEHRIPLQERQRVANPAASSDPVAPEGTYQQVRIDLLVDLLNKRVDGEVPAGAAPTALGLHLRSPAGPADWRSSAWPSDLWRRRCNRKLLDQLLDSLGLPEPEFASAAAARGCAAQMFRHAMGGVIAFWSCLAAFLALGALMVFSIVSSGYNSAEGEPFSLVSGTSAWPAQILRLLATVLAVGFVAALHLRLRSTMLRLTRSYRLPNSCPPSRGPGRISAVAWWQNLNVSGTFLRRLGRSALPIVMYLGLGFILMQLTQFPTSPVRGDVITLWNKVLIFTSVVAFLLLSFLTVDAALRCRRFINDLASAPTDYPESTRCHFRSLRGDVSEELLDEWIDTQLIADLTERVQSLLWLPSFVFMLMLAARMEWWDRWPWSGGLIVIMSLNFILALSSVIILQVSARAAKRTAEENLDAKVKRLHAAVAPSRLQNDANQAEKLLQEIRELRRGAFTGFWENPVLGALLVPSSGVVLLEVMSWFVGR